MADYNNNNKRQATTTQIRNIYSEGIASIRIMFYNMNLSLQFQPFSGKDNNGISRYDYQKSITTTIPWDYAFAMYQTGTDIIQGNAAAQGLDLNIPCNDASIKFERKPGQMGQMETWITITKNNQSIPFKFNTHQVKQMDNGQMAIKTIEVGLGTFIKTLDGYLTGINADRHLDKLTDDYIKSLGDKAQSGNQGFQTNSGYNKGNYNNNRNRNWNNNRKPYNNQNQGGVPQQQQSWENNKPQQNQQSMSNYNLPQN